MNAEQMLPGSIDRVIYDLYQVTGDTMEGAMLVDWMDGRIRHATPNLHQYVGGTKDAMMEAAPQFEVRLIPHVGYEDQYAEGARLLGMSAAQ